MQKVEYGDADMSSQNQTVLTDEERTTLSIRFSGQTLEETATQIKTTPERIRDIETLALAKIGSVTRHPSSKNSKEIIRQRIMGEF